MKDIIRHELIGLDVKIVDSKNKNNIGIEGKIIDETRNTLIIDTKKGRKKLIKDQIIVEFIKERIRVEGRLLVGRPEDRIKKKIK